MPLRMILNPTSRARLDPLPPPQFCKKICFAHLLLNFTFAKVRVTKGYSIYVTDEAQFLFQSLLDMSQKRPIKLTFPQICHERHDIAHLTPDRSGIACAVVIND